MAAGRRLDLPVVDLASPDPRAAAKSIRQACVEYGFFYVINHGIERALLERVFADSRKFFEQTMEEKMALRKNSRHRGYTWPYSEKVDDSPESRGDSKETFYIGPMDDEKLENNINQWPSEELFPSWKKTMQSYHANALLFEIGLTIDPSLDSYICIPGQPTVLEFWLACFPEQKEYPTKLWATGKRILSLIALSLDLDAEFFHKNGAFEPPSAFLRLLHYAGDVNGPDNKDIIGAAAHSDYGMLTLLATDGTPGLQICREKDRHPQIWEDVHHIDGSLIVNIGDLLERWTNCVFRSTLHRVVPVGKERYSVAFFIDPSPNLVVKCMESCCSEAYPARFAPIKSGDYIEERLSSAYKLATS